MQQIDFCKSFHSSQKILFEAFSTLQVWRGRVLSWIKESSGTLQRIYEIWKCSILREYSYNFKHREINHLSVVLAPGLDSSDIHSIIKGALNKEEPNFIRKVEPFFRNVQDAEEVIDLFETFSSIPCRERDDFIALITPLLSDIFTKKISRKIFRALYEIPNLERRETFQPLVKLFEVTWFRKPRFRTLLEVLQKIPSDQRAKAVRTLSGVDFRFEECCFLDKVIESLSSDQIVEALPFIEAFCLREDQSRRINLNFEYCDPPEMASFLALGSFVLRSVSKEEIRRSVFSLFWKKMNREMIESSPRVLSSLNKITNEFTLKVTQDYFEEIIRFFYRSTREDDFRKIINYILSIEPNLDLLKYVETLLANIEDLEDSFKILIAFSKIIPAERKETNESLKEYFLKKSANERVSYLEQLSSIPINERLAVYRLIKVSLEQERQLFKPNLPKKNTIPKRDLKISDVFSYETLKLHSEELSVWGTCEVALRTVYGTAKNEVSNVTYCTFRHITNMLDRILIFRELHRLSYDEMSAFIRRVNYFFSPQFDNQQHTLLSDLLTAFCLNALPSFRKEFEASRSIFNRKKESLARFIERLFKESRIEIIHQRFREENKFPLDEILEDTDAADYFVSMQADLMSEQIGKRGLNNLNHQAKVNALPLLHPEMIREIVRNTSEEIGAKYLDIKVELDGDDPKPLREVLQLGIDENLVWMEMGDSENDLTGIEQFLHSIPPYSLALASHHPDFQPLVLPYLKFMSFQQLAVVIPQLSVETFKNVIKRKKNIDVQTILFLRVSTLEQKKCFLNELMQEFSKITLSYYSSFTFAMISRALKKSLLENVEDIGFILAVENFFKEGEKLLQSNRHRSPLVEYQLLARVGEGL